MDKREAIAKAILDALRKDDSGAYVGSPGEDDLSDMVIDGRFNLLVVADAILAALTE